MKHVIAIAVVLAVTVLSYCAQTCTIPVTAAASCPAHHRSDCCDHHKTDSGSTGLDSFALTIPAMDSPEVILAIPLLLDLAPAYPLEVRTTSPPCTSSLVLRI